jgi:hypothetical protein
MFRCTVERQLHEDGEVTGATEPENSVDLLAACYSSLPTVYRLLVSLILPEPYKFCTDASRRHMKRITRIVTASSLTIYNT